MLYTVSVPSLPNAVKSAAVILVSVAIIAATFLGGVYVGYERRPAIEKVQAIFGKELTKPQDVDFSLFWEVWSELETKYVDRESIDRKKLVEGAISGLVKAVGDPYTVFMPPRQSQLFREDVRGSFGGIGAEIGIRKEILTVISPLKGSPAERAGLKPGDKIFKINATTTEDLSLEEAVSLIRGPIGTPVKLTISRDDDVSEVEIIRNVIVVPILNTERKGDGIFAIRLMNFNEKSTSEFRRAIREFVEAGDSKLILDLRSNPGGYLDAAVDIASWFVPAGEVVAREKLAGGKEILYRSSGHRLLETVPVVVMVNQGSASASEIVAGALHDAKGIKLVGEKTFGKGSVQQVEDLRGGASLKITIAKWLTPNGTSINEKGLEPDIEVKIAKDDVEAGLDPQLEKAIEILKAM